MVFLRKAKILFCLLTIISHPLWAQPLSSKNPRSEEAIHNHGHFKTHRVSESSFDLSRTMLSDDHPRNRPIGIDVLDYALKINVDPVTARLRGSVVITYKAREDGLSSIDFDAYNMRILDVQKDSQTQLYFYDGEVITIPLAQPMVFGETQSVEIFYQIERSQSLFSENPDLVNPQGMKAAYTFTQPEGSRDWFPCIDRPNEKAQVSMQISVPFGFKALSNGNLISHESKDGQELFTYEMRQPMAPYLLSLAIGPYEVYKISEFKGKALTLWTPKAIEQAALRETAHTLEMMQSFSRFTGLDYPFASYTQSVAPAWGSSMEHQSATTMGGWRIAGDQTGEGVVAHELAHQWFGDWVTCEKWTELWLNEGFASYLPFVFFKDMGNNNSALSYEDYWRSDYFEQAKTTVHPLSSTQLDIDNIFDSHTYEKGALVIKLMRYMASQLPNTKPEVENFTQALQLYLTRHGGKNVRNADLQKALEEVTGHSWETFFTQWVRSSGHPQLSAQWQQDGESLFLDIKQNQALREGDKKWGLFSFPLQVEVLGEGQKRLVYKLNVFQSRHRFVFKPGFPVQSLQLDPEWIVPAEIELTQARSAWIELLRASPSLKSRMIASRQLLKSPVDESLLAVLLTQESTYLLADSLDVMIQDKSNVSSVRAVLDHLQGLPHPDSIVKAALAQAQTWLLAQAAVVPSSEEQKQWQTEYLKEDLTTDERKFILDKIKLYSISEAQSFALARLQEAHWVTKDRAYLLDVLSTQVTDVSLPFITASLTQGLNNYWFKRLIKNLVKLRYEDSELIPVLLRQAQEYPYLGGRIAAISWLGVQTQNKDLVCPSLEVLAKASEGFDPLSEVRDSARLAVAKLCL